MPRIFTPQPHTLSKNQQWRFESRNYNVYLIYNDNINDGGGSTYVGLTSIAIEERLNWHIRQSQNGTSEHPLQKAMSENPDGWEIKVIKSVVGNYYEARKTENSMKKKMAPTLNYTSSEHIRI